MQKLNFLILLLAMGCPGLSSAQANPSFDCAKAQSSAEELICQDAELASLDRSLAERYAQAVNLVGSLDAGAADASAELRATQRGWIKGRDDCWKADDMRICVRNAYLSRDAYLTARWLLREPASIVFWACDGSPANEVVTYLFDTALPSLRFERSDSIDIGLLEPTASGVRYNGSFGRWIWFKGDQATYRDPDPDGQTYECLKTGEG